MNQLANNYSVFRSESKRIPVQLFPVNLMSRSFVEEKKEGMYFRHKYLRPRRNIATKIPWTPLYFIGGGRTVVFMIVFGRKSRKYALRMTIIFEHSYQYFSHECHVRRRETKVSENFCRLRLFFRFYTRLSWDRRGRSCGRKYRSVFRKMCASTRWFLMRTRVYGSPEKNKKSEGVPV